MTITEKLLLGANTAMIGMGIVFLVLVVLWAVIVAQSKLISFFSERFKKLEVPDFPIKVDKVDVDRKGITSGESVVLGIDDEETLAVIMTAVSNHADIPLSRLQFKSIKAQ